jgi:hypothetical protein
MLIQDTLSCPDLIRASIKIMKAFSEDGWMAGSSPAMTKEGALRATWRASFARLGARKGEG